jgi:anti-sigma regulatory factor (Ser/Thr protein kinase)/putative methionine-R-sulfoxide reductase with GAF domain
MLEPPAAYVSLEGMLADLLERIRGQLGTDTAAVLLMDEDRNVLVARAARGLEEEVRQGVQVPLARGFAGRVAEHACPIVIPDLATADVVNPILREKGLTSLLGVPILAGERVIGVMHVGTMAPREFGDRDIRFLQRAAGRAAAAIDQARATEQRAVTEIMQRTLLPDALPDIAGLRFSAKYMPAGTGVRIGGDWYDVFQLDDGRVTFVVGDVVGRGVVAASMMAELRTALRAYRMEGHELDDVMGLLNTLVTSIGRDRSATLAILELDLERDELSAVSAGHPPVLLVTPDGEAQFAEFAQNGPIGISPAARYTVRRHRFPAGSAMLLYTDGLVERRSEPLDRGLERLRAAAADAAREASGRFADRVYRRLADKTSADDDIALLVVESLALDPTLTLTVEATTPVLPAMRRTVGRWLRSQGCDDDETFDIALATSEAASNAIEHAYGARESTFTLACAREPHGVRIAVGDRGRWRQTKPFGRGRGLKVMRGLMDSVDVVAGAHGTTVVLTKRVAAEAP